MRVRSESPAGSMQAALTALDSLPDTSVLVFDRELRFVVAGGRPMDHAGYSPAIIEGRKAQDVIPAPRWAVYEPLYRAALNGATGSVELPGIDEERWFRVQVGPLRDDAGTISGGVVVARDITEQRRLERELRDSRDRLWATLDGIEVLVTVKDSQERYLMVNRAYERELGVRREDLVGRTAADVFPANIAAEYASDDRRVLETGRTLRSERPGLHSDGTMHVYHMVRSPLQVRSGEICGVVAAGTDLTDLRRAQSALHEVEELFERSFEHALVGMVLASPNGRMQRVNQAFAEMTGHTVEALMGRTFAAIAHPADLEQGRAQLERMLAAESPPILREQRLVRADGEVIWAEVAASVIRAADGAPRHLVVQARDVTERRRLEEQLRHEADHDPLTGVLNRRRFSRLLAAQVARCRSGGEHAALLMLDLDRLKQLNDEHGHIAGDEALRRVAAAATEHLPPGAVLGRLGGDEFAVLTGPTTRDGAEALAAELAAAIAAEPPLACGVPLSVSVGAVSIDPAMSSEDDALAAADRRMYRAKRARGRASP